MEDYQIFLEVDLVISLLGSDVHMINGGCADMVEGALLKRNSNSEVVRECAGEINLWWLVACRNWFKCNSMFII